MLRSLCLILFLCCVLVAGAFPGTGRAQTDALPHLEQIAVRGKTSVASCLDGDTMQLTNRSRVRLAGIDTPELKPRKGKPQFYAREARELLTRLARGQEVRFFAVDKEGKDKYGRIVADARPSSIPTRGWTRSTRTGCWACRPKPSRNGAACGPRCSPAPKP